MYTNIYKTRDGYAAVTEDDYGYVFCPREQRCCQHHMHLFRKTMRRDGIRDIDDYDTLPVPDPWDCEPREFYDGLREIDAVWWCSIEVVDGGGYDSTYRIADVRTYDADGVAYVTREDLQEWGREDMTREEFRAEVAAELQEYEDWANGYVYTIQTFNNAGNPAGEYATSCCGFIGDNYALHAAGVYNSSKYVAPLATGFDGDPAS